MTHSNIDVMARMNAYIPATGIMLGMTLVELDQEAGFVRMTFNVNADFCNPMGNVQGGIIAAMLDDTAAYAIIAKALTIPVFEGKRIGVPTIEFKTSFFSSAHAGPLVTEARCLKFGRTIAFAEAKLFDTEGKTLAVMTTTVMPTALTKPANLVERPKL